MFARGWREREREASNMATENIGGGGGVSSNPNTASSSRSNASADSYIGSLISLTSKSEIRYEGILYNINTEESSIGLRNVRSFGTEGRKKDGPQIPPSDKVYEYILFRGTDIKDLQVKSSPSVQSTTPINNDPAIIQSHFPRPVSSSTNLLSAASGSLSDIGSPMGLPGTNFQGGLPLYQPGGNLGTWGASPVPPTANGSGLAMPMYWQGYYGPPNGLPPHLHQQSLIRPPPGLSMPASMQQPPQYPNFNTHLLSGNSTPPNANLSASNLPASTLPVASLSLSTLPFSNLPTSTLPVSNLPASTLPEIPSPLHPIGNSHTFTPTPSAPSTLPSSLPLLPSTSLASETLPYLMPAKAASSVHPATNLSTSLPSISPLTTTSPEISTIVPPISSKSGTVSGPTNSYQNASQQTSSGVLTSSSFRVETPTPSLVTPGQLLQSGPTAVSSYQQTPQPIQAAHKDVEVVPVSSSPPPEPSVPLAAEAQPPILPLPVPSRGSQRQNGAHFHNRHGYYGRERGRGTTSSRPVTKFTEEFDFIAMNEKFKKDEVWGHLGKSKFHSKDNDDGNFGGEDDSQYEEDDESAKIDVKPIYNKDDFFDTLSCNALDHESQNVRTKFSEQMKIDTETFGDFSRYRGGRGGRWPPRGGRSRGSYYGRDYGRGYGYGYGHAGRGRGRGMPGRAP